LKECALCGEQIDEQSEDQVYSYDAFLHELDKQGKELYRCRKCMEILRSESSKNVPSKDVIRVNISKSDYHLPGFVLSKDKSHYFKPKKRKSVILR